MSGKLDYHQNSSKQEMLLDAPTHFFFKKQYLLSFSDYENNTGSWYLENTKMYTA